MSECLGTWLWKDPGALLPCLYGVSLGSVSVQPLCECECECVNVCLLTLLCVSMKTGECGRACAFSSVYVSM